MTPAQLELVRTSYATLQDGGAAMAADFYRNLFEIAPQTRTLFATEPDVMTVKANQPALFAQYRWWSPHHRIDRFASAFLRR